MAAAQLGTAVISCAGGDPIALDAGTGGATGGSSGGTAGSGGSGGGSGGTLACAGTWDPAGGDCGACELSVQDYCADHDCQAPDTYEYCYGHGLYWITTRGCGYLRIERRDGLSDHVLWIDIWDEASEELVYHASRSAAGDACEPELLVGQEPTCAGYAEVCDSGQVCPFPPHWECLGCAPGCLYEPFTSCKEMEAASSFCQGQGGAGGEGGAGP